MVYKEKHYNYNNNNQFHHNNNNNNNQIDNNYNILDTSDTKSETTSIISNNTTSTIDTKFFDKSSRTFIPNKYNNNINVPPFHENLLITSLKTNPLHKDFFTKIDNSSMKLSDAVLSCILQKIIYLNDQCQKSIYNIKIFKNRKDSSNIAFKMIKNGSGNSAKYTAIPLEDIKKCDTKIYLKDFYKIINQDNKNFDIEKFINKDEVKVKIKNIPKYILKKYIHPTTSLTIAFCINCPWDPSIIFICYKTKTTNVMHTQCCYPFNLENNKFDFTNYKDGLSLSFILNIASNFVNITNFIHNILSKYCPTKNHQIVCDFLGIDKQKVIQPLNNDNKDNNDQFTQIKNDNIKTYFKIQKSLNPIYKALNLLNIKGTSLFKGTSRYLIKILIARCLTEITNSEFRSIKNNNKFKLLVKIRGNKVLTFNLVYQPKQTNNIKDKDLFIITDWKIEYSTKNYVTNKDKSSIKIDINDIKKAWFKQPSSPSLSASTIPLDNQKLIICLPTLFLPNTDCYILYNQSYKIITKSNQYNVFELKIKNNQAIKITTMSIIRMFIMFGITYKDIENYFKFDSPSNWKHKYKLFVEHLAKNPESKKEFDIANNIINSRNIIVN